MRKVADKFYEEKLDTTVKEIDAFSPNHIALENYQHHPALRAPISV